MAVQGIAAAVIILVFVTKHLRKQRLQFYQKQGFGLHENGSGFISLMVPHKGTSDQMETMNEQIRKNQDKPGVALINELNGTCVQLLHREEYLREFFNKEIQYTIKKYSDSFEELFGFFFKNGKEAFLKRAIFTEIFVYEKVECKAKELYKIMESSLQKFSESYSVGSNTKDNKWTKLPQNLLLHEVFNEWVKLILFGTQQLPEELKIDGKDITIKLKELIVRVFDQNNNKWHILTRYMFQNSRFFKGNVLRLDLDKKIIECLASEYQRRYLKFSDKNSEISTNENILDQMVLHNLKCEEENTPDKSLKLADIIADMKVFSFAGSDTCQNATNTALIYLNKDEGLVDILQRELSQKIFGDKANLTKFDGNSFDECPKLNQFMMEVLRLGTPPSILVPRVVFQEITLKDVVVNKGDSIVVPLHSMGYQDNLWENPKKFDIERFSDKNLKDMPKISYMPFSNGKRNCIGQNMGKLMTKIVLSCLLNCFEMRKPNGFAEEFVMHPFYAPKETLVEVKLRQEGSELSAYM